MMFNLTLATLQASVERHPSKIALILHDPCGNSQTLSYEQLFGRISEVARDLQSQGFTKGNRIVLWLPQGLEFIVAFFGVILQGCVAVPVSPQSTPTEVAFFIDDTKASGLITQEESWKNDSPHCRKIVLDFSKTEIDSFQNVVAVTTGENDPAFIVYTSGTSDKPKGVLHAQRFLLGRRPMFQGWTQMGPNDVVFHTGELNWTYTMGVGLMDPWVMGATAVISRDRLSPESWLPVVDQYHVTVLAAVPTLYRRMLKYSDFSKCHLRSLRHGLSAGERLSAALLQQWQACSGHPLFEALGMSEISTFISTHAGAKVKPGSCGQPQPGRKVCLLPVDGGEQRVPDGEVGCIAIHRQDPGLMLGYLHGGLPPENMRGDWFVTQDLAWRDSDGYFWYIGRNDDVIKSMGYRLAPLEIEAVLEQHPLVQESAIALVRVGDHDLTTAFVVSSGGDLGEAESLDILNFAKARLAAYKVPKRLVFVSHLPRNKNGKLQRQKLREMIHE